MFNFTKSKIIWISIFAVPIFVLVAIFFTIGIINKPKKATKKEIIEETPTQQLVKQPKSFSGLFSGVNLDLEDFTFTEYTQTDNGIEKNFVLCGKKLQTKNPKIGIFRIAIGKIIELESPMISFYKDNLLVSTITSKTGTMNPLNKALNFYGNVGLITKDKKTLTCSKLKWYKEKKYLLAEGDSILKAEGKTIRAEKIKTDIELKNFNVVSKNRRLLKTLTQILH
ncbi:MAG: LPS export ABC transporter periplasmic protein LptC [Candidatus Omnitrophica bacterium]|nr:LPS export ABC transporter periplasmic protein LptC [Candidatus Omnitrophota bacterium]